MVCSINRNNEGPIKTELVFEEQETPKIIADSGFTIHIPDSKVELSKIETTLRRNPFCTLRNITFGPNSKLECIGQELYQSLRAVKEVSIPDSVRELCDRCFYECRNLKRVTFGLGSKLERIGKWAFFKTSVEEVNIPDNVRELCESCFNECCNLRDVTFGLGSKLELIGQEGFFGTNIVSVRIPDSVVELGDGCLSN